MKSIQKLQNDRPNQNGETKRTEKMLIITIMIIICSNIYEKKGEKRKRKKSKRKEKKRSHENRGKENDKRQTIKVIFFGLKLGSS